MLLVVLLPGQLLVAMAFVVFLAAFFVCLFRKYLSKLKLTWLIFSLENNMKTVINNLFTYLLNEVEVWPRFGLTEIDSLAGLCIVWIAIRRLLTVSIV